MINPRTDDDCPVRARPLLDTPACASDIASTVRHVRRMVAERTLPHHKVGHVVRVDPDELDELDELDEGLLRNRRPDGAVP